MYALKVYRGFESRPLRHLNFAGSRSALFAVVTTAAWFEEPPFVIGGAPKILIIRLSAIGDVVRVLPAAAAIRRAYPSAQIDWVVESAAADILFDNPLLDRVIVFDRGPRWLRNFVRFMGLRSRLREQRYDIAIDFHGVIKSGFLLGSTRAKRRISFGPPRSREGAFLFANERFALSEPVMNRVDENLELASTSMDNVHNVRLPFMIDEQINVDVFRMITELRKNRRWLVIVHAPVDRAEKRWPTERFIALINLLFEDGRFDVVLTHGPGQRGELDCIVDVCSESPIVPPECQSLREYAGLAAMASLYIGVDTGPMHIAAAVGTPVVAIFGGTAPSMHSPVGSACRTLGGITVQRCTDRVSLTEATRVLESVSPDEVFAAALDVLSTER